MSNFLPLLKRVARWSRGFTGLMVRWRKGHTFKHHGMWATFSGRHVLFKNERT